jgi:hypothetical protein
MEEAIIISAALFSRKVTDASSWLNYHHHVLGWNGESES